VKDESRCCDATAAWHIVESKPQTGLANAVPIENDSRPRFYRLAVLISGRGSNLQSIIDAIASRRLDAAIAVVLSNRAAAPGLARAREAGLDALHLDPAAYASRDAYDEAIVDLLRARRVDLVCLAGFMRLVGPRLLDAFDRRILNIHPSLLPAFPGLDAQRQALEWGARVSGATVHLVTSELDAGPIVLQAAVPVHADDTVDSLSARILVEEHRIYPEAIGIVLAGGWHIEGRRFVRALPARQAAGSVREPPALAD
jgi:phosphoribosylglycinamide formyltransferase 1